MYQKVSATANVYNNTATIFIRAKTVNKESTLDNLNVSV